MFPLERSRPPYHTLSQAYSIPLLLLNWAFESTLQRSCKLRIGYSL